MFDDWQPVSVIFPHQIWLSVTREGWSVGRMRRPRLNPRLREMSAGASINDLSPCIFPNPDISTRNDCEMTHFFFSLIREPAPVSERTELLAPLMFYFDTHIITQVNLNVKHTVFDKVDQWLMTDCTKYLSKL